MKTGHLQNIQSFETSIETRNLRRYGEQSIVFSQIFMLNMTKISYLDMSHFLIFSMTEKDGFFCESLTCPDTKPRQLEHVILWNSFSVFVLHERKCTLLALSVSSVLTQNQNISNFNSSLTWNNAKLISYFRSPW